MRKILTAALIAVTGITHAQCFEKVSASAFHFVAIAQDGTLWAWGANNLGQLGDGTIINKSTPVQIGTANNWFLVSAGESHTMAIKIDGTLWAWGNDNYQRLGNGNADDSLIPVQIGTDNNWKEVSAGERGTVAVKTNGTLWAWGTNTGGYLGNGAAAGFASNVPLQIGSATDWLTVSGNGRHCLAIKTNGTLWAWGLNGDGQLGNATTTNSTTPLQVGTATDWKWIDASSRVSFALKTNNSLWGWGYLAGMSFEFSSPQQIGTATDWKTVSVKKQAQSQYLLMTKTDGTLWAWGNDASEQLGNGAVDGNYTNPTQVSSATDWTNATAGYFQSSAVKTTGTFWVWGDTELVVNGGGFVVQPTHYSCTSLSTNESNLTGLKLYPNPVSEKLTIELDGEVTSLKIYDLNGRDIEVSNTGKTLDLSHLSAGIYLLSIRTLEGEAMKKIVKR